MVKNCSMGCIGMYIYLILFEGVIMRRGALLMLFFLTACSSGYLEKKRYSVGNLISFKKIAVVSCIGDKDVVVERKMSGGLTLRQIFSISNPMLAFVSETIGKQKGDLVKFYSLGEIVQKDGLRDFFKTEYGGKPDYVSLNNFTFPKALYQKSDVLEKFCLKSGMDAVLFVELRIKSLKQVLLYDLRFSMVDKKGDKVYQQYYEKKIRVKAVPVGSILAAQRAADLPNHDALKYARYSPSINHSLLNFVIAGVRNFFSGYFPGSSKDTLEMGRIISSNFVVNVSKCCLMRDYEMEGGKVITYY